MDGMCIGSTNGSMPATPEGTNSSAETNTTEDTNSSADSNSPIVTTPTTSEENACALPERCHLDSDSTQSDILEIVLSPRKSFCNLSEQPPIGVYWDIENCQVPKNKSAAGIVQRVRDEFFEGHRQVEFVVVCDVWKETAHVLNDLQDAQVNVIHVKSISKNAADEKLRQSLRHFGNTYKAPATVVLISSDINFASDISDLRYCKQLHIILVHNKNVSKVLKRYAHETYLFTDLTDSLPMVAVKTPQTADIYVSNLPNGYEKKLLKNRLKFLSDNCGGRVVAVDPETGTAVIRCSSLHVAIRAQRRLNGEDVYGRKIVASATELPNGLNKSQGRKNSKYFYSNDSNSRPNQGSSRGDWRSPLNRTPDSQTNSLNCDRSLLPANNSVELIISNLDTNIRDLRMTLYNHLKQYGTLHSISLNYHDVKPSAVVKVANRQDAEFIISKMHRQKVGSRRISIAYARPRGGDDDELKERIVYLLKESPTNSIPLYLLLITLETKYLMHVSLHEITKLRDVCQIVEENGERLVTLTPEVLANVPANLQKPQQMHYCCVHCPNGITDITVWQPDVYQPPCVNMSLKEFSRKLNKMLTSHMGTLPLLSFTICYSYEFGEPLLTNGVDGVPLEHLVTCVSNVTIKYENAKNKAKYIVWEMALKPDDSENLSSSPLASSIYLLRREFVDLVHHEARCQIPLGKFVPAYHHHFGRQLRVADYGYTKLDDLLHSPHLSKVVQILGEGSNRILTLTHSAQMRRFINDLQRVLKTQISKSITLKEFNEIYLSLFRKDFAAHDYGLCSIEDLLDEMPDHVITLDRSSQELTMGIPRRARTSDEIFRTKQFSADVVKLLSHSPNNSILFDKFVPHYHHHFGYQCKVSDYGFTKLIELFEAIPETVKVEELPNCNRRISLTAEQSLNLLGNRLVDLIKKSSGGYLLLDQLAHTYMQEYKVPLTPQLYNCCEVKDVIDKLTEFVTLTHSHAGQILTIAVNSVIPVQKNVYSTFALRVWSLLVTPPHQCEAHKLIFRYYMRFHTTITIAYLEHLDNIIITRASNTEITVSLVPHFIKVARFYQLLRAHGGQMPFSHLGSWYQTEFGEKQPDEKAYEKFLTDCSFLYVLSRTRKKSVVALNPKLSELHLPLTQDANSCDSAHSFWPAEPSRALVQAATKYSPPKPDSPPPVNGNELLAWQPLQLTPTADMEFFISLPQPDAPKNLSYFNTLISPSKTLLPAHPMGSIISAFPSSPDASELPNPDKLIKSVVCSDDSGDSGVNNSHFASADEMDVSYDQNSGARSKNSRTNSDYTMQHP